MPGTNQILMIGPSFAFRGGISRVAFNYHLAGFFNNGVEYLPSTIEGSIIVRLCFTVNQLFLFLIKLLTTKYVLVHIHTSSRSSFFRKSLFALIAKMLNRKIIFHIHPTHFYGFISQLKNPTRFLVYKMLNLGDSLIVLTEDMQARMGRFFPRTSIRVLPNPVNSRELKVSYTRREKNVLLYMGTFLAQKGVDDLIKAAPFIFEELPDLKIVLCGEKGKTRLEKEVRKSRQDGQIEIRGWVDGWERIRLLRSSTAVILPSYSEGIPNIILEAMATCLPIVATPVGGIPAILQEGVNCLFFEPGDILGLTNSVIRMFKEPELRETIAQNNFIKAKSFETSIIIEKLGQIYQNLGLK